VREAAAGARVAAGAAADQVHAGDELRAGQEYADAVCGAAAVGEGEEGVGGGLREGDEAAGGARRGVGVGE